MPPNPSSWPKRAKPSAQNSVKAKTDWRRAFGPATTCKGGPLRRLDYALDGHCRGASISPATKRRTMSVSVTGIRFLCAAALVTLIQMGSTSTASAAYSICASAENIHRQHVVCGSGGCAAGELSVFSSAANHSVCGSSAQSEQAPAAQARSCGRYWSDWEPRNRSVGNPCPSGCRPEVKVRDQSRGAGRRAEHRELWQCTPR
jgi:hypothetical protein